METNGRASANGDQNKVKKTAKQTVLDTHKGPEKTNTDSRQPANREDGPRQENWPGIPKDLPTTKTEVGEKGGKADAIVKNHQKQGETFPITHHTTKQTTTTMNPDKPEDSPTPDNHTMSPGPEREQENESEDGNKYKTDAKVTHPTSTSCKWKTVKMKTTA